MWTLGFAATEISDFLDNTKAVKTLVQWLKRAQIGDICIVAGPVGCGKTSAIEYACRQHNCRMLNVETPKDIIAKDSKKRKLTKAAKKRMDVTTTTTQQKTRQTSLTSMFCPRPVVAVYTERRTGEPGAQSLKDIKKIQHKLYYPLILERETDDYTKSRSGSYDSHVLIRMQHMSKTSMKQILKQTMIAHNHTPDQRLVEHICASHTNIRSAINTLQSACSDTMVDTTHLDQVIPENIFTALDLIQLDTGVDFDNALAIARKYGDGLTNIYASSHGNITQSLDQCAQLLDVMCDGNTLPFEMLTEQSNCDSEVLTDLYWTTRIVIPCMIGRGRKNYQKTRARPKFGRKLTIKNAVSAVQGESKAARKRRAKQYIRAIKELDNIVY